MRGVGARPLAIVVSGCLLDTIMMMFDTQISIVFCIMQWDEKALDTQFTPNVYFWTPSSEILAKAQLGAIAYFATILQNIGGFLSLSLCGGLGIRGRRNCTIFTTITSKIYGSLLVMFCTGVG